MPAEPFLKWVGGKRKLLSQLLPLLPTMRPLRYIEPFLGSGAMFFAIRALHGADLPAVLGDRNPALIETYKAIQSATLLPRVRAQLDLLKRRHRLDAEGTYYKVRELFNKQLLRVGKADTQVTLAANFIYLNKTCWNGVWRVNRGGSFNVPIGSYESPVIYTPAALAAASHALCSSTLMCTDFESLLRQASDRGRDALFYLDPPYVPVSATANFRSYTADGFGDHDLVRLEICCRKIDRAGGYFMLSNSDTEKVHKTFSKFNITEVSRNGAINSAVEKRGRVGELVIRNYG